MKRYFVLAVVALGLVFTACDEEENLNSSVWIGSESESNVIAQLDTLYLDARIENLSGAMRYLWTVETERKFQPLQHISFHSLRLESML